MLYIFNNDKNIVGIDRVLKKNVYQHTLPHSSEVYLVETISKQKLSCDQVWINCSGACNYFCANSIMQLQAPVLMAA